jgi:P27 family predicted phage terminase small subunit
MTGRKPKPTKRQISAGDPRDRGKRKLQEKLDAEPQASRGLPTCPRHLRGRARACWNFWTRELELMDLDARPDAQMLEGACVGYERAVQADLLLQKEGLVVEDCKIVKDVIIVLKRRAHPAIMISRTSWRQVQAFCSEFGLSPVSRTRLAVEKPENGESDLMKLLSAPRISRTAAPVN